MSPLRFVEPEATPQTVNVLLYGPPGTGKTVGACSAPGPILVINAEGPGALLYARREYGDEKIREVRFEGKNTLDDAYTYLRSKQGGERTVVLDTIGEVYEALVTRFANGGKVQLQHYGEVNTTIDRFVRALRDLDLNVVLVAHEQIDDEGGEITRRPATGGKKLPEKVMAQMDVVAYTGVATDDEGRRYMGQLVEANGRRAKDRSGVLGNARELDLTEWVETIAEAMRPVPIDDARAKRLLEGAETAGITVKQIGAWFNARLMEFPDEDYPEVKKKADALGALSQLVPDAAEAFEEFISAEIEKHADSREASLQSEAEAEAA